MKTYKLFLAFSISAWACVPIQAQQTLTLADCIRMALERNVSVKQADVARRTAQTDLMSARNARLPQISAGAGEGLNFGRSLTSQNTYAATNTYTTNFSVSASMPLFTGLRIHNQKKQSALQLKISQEDLEKVKDDLTLNVMLAYLQVLYTKDRVRIAREQLTLAATETARRRHLLSVGKIAGSDVSEAESAEARDHLALTEAQNAETLARLDLSQLLEIPSPEGLETVVPEDEPQALLPDPTEVFHKAMTIKPQIAAGRLHIENAETAVKIARADYMPSVSLGAGLGTSYYKTSAFENSAFGRQLKDNFGKYISLNVSIPIFNGFATRDNIRRAKLRKEEACLNLEQSEKTLYKEIQTAYYNARGAYAKYESAVAVQQAAEETFTLIARKYELGKASATEYEQQRTAYTEAQIERVTAHYEYLFRTGILRFYSGETPNF